MKPVDSQKVIEFLNEKWNDRTCPMCGEGNWNVQDHVFQLIVFSEGTMIVGGPVVPLIPVSCGNCGNTVLVNAIIAGAVTPAASDTGEKS